jgi:thiol-disulfide isomerase/thioredoxin
MATAPPPTGPPLPSSRPSHRFGILLAPGGQILFGAILVSAFCLILGRVSLAQLLLLRVSLLAVVFTATPVLSRLIAGESASRLMMSGRFKGDFGGGIGLLAGLLLLPAGLASYLDPEPRVEGTLVIGRPVEIAGPTLDGGRFDLADHRGKVVLVDFWATWCRPCIAELPNVRKVYDEYHDRGLEAVSISLDENRSALVDFLQAKPLPWSQIFFDPTDAALAEQNPANRYNIEAIPCLLVVDRAGNLVAKDVRGDEIQVAVARALGRSVTEDRNSWADHLVSAGWKLINAAVYSALVSPWWSLLACSLSGAVFGAALERLVRLVYRRPQCPQVS